MKELSIEEKAKAYDKALKYAMIYYKEGNEDMKMMIKTCFPALVEESSDERIRKEIISFLKSPFVNESITDEKVAPWITWLERQCEHAKFRDSIQIGDKITRNQDGVLVNLSQLNRVAKKDEKQGEQKKSYDTCDFSMMDDKKSPYGEKRDFGYFEEKPTDKVEPKFKVGDWVIDKQNIVHQIAKVIENVTYHTYGYDIVGGGYFNDNIEGVRLWTIQDAKDGDVLCVKYGNDEMPFIFTGKQDNVAYCALNSFGEFVLSIAGWLLKTSVLPANKKQCDLLFQKMKEASYEWDAEKKELKKIKQKSADKVEPKFRIGDIIEMKLMKCHDKIFTGKPNKIVDITEESYILDDGKAYSIELQDGWKLSEQNHVWGEDEMIRKALIQFFLKSAVNDESTNGIPDKDILAWLEKQNNIIKLSEEEQNRFAKGVLTRCALSFIDYIDAHKYEGKMCVSNGECEDIENAFHNSMWDRLHRYYCKYIEKQC